MLIQSGLYYPYIHIRNDTWLKAAALYWKRMDRIVPSDYPTQDSHTVRSLKDKLGFIEERQPGQAAVETSRLFLDLLAERGSEFVEKLQIQPSPAELMRLHDRPRDGGLSTNGTIGYIFAQKLSPQLVDAMATEGLAFGASSKQSGYRRLSTSVGSANWIGMDSRLAATYMTVLARLTAHHFDLNPVTDVPIAHTAMGGLSVDAIANALIGHAPSSSTERQTGMKQQRVAMLAVQTVIPGGLGLVDVEAIIRFRMKHDGALSAFQTAVAAAADELTSLPADVDAAVLRDRVIEVTHQHLLKPREELEAALNLFGLETIKSAMTLQVPLSAGAGPIVGAATTPIIGTATAAGAVLLAFGGTEVGRRRVLKKSGAANYLMELRSSLTPKSVLRRKVRGTIDR